MLTVLTLWMLAAEPSRGIELAAADAPLLTHASSTWSARSSPLRRENLLVQLAEMNERSVLGPALLTTLGGSALISGLLMSALAVSSGRGPIFQSFGNVERVYGFALVGAGLLLIPIGVALVVRAIRHNEARDDLLRELHEREPGLVASASGLAFTF